ncbi:hypothetical protein AV926_06540 [Myroides marinus]|uniref:MORN repeat variant n=1 Tax=Myroides marinus TaxID=703342 RepID=A0A163ZZX9_9FLAO|nr:hypothetical protein [Myroides marinus]KZE82761.1 hypothetical protein AV926_06540 [Myroides marinus]
MRHISVLIALILITFFSSCKVNQKVNGEKVGKWVYKTTINEKTDIHKGRYKKDGFQKGTWRYKYDGKLYKKEEFKDSTAVVTYYHPNRKVASIGNIIFVKEKKGLHYYYVGSWFIYNPKGTLIEVKHYSKGVLEHHTIVRQ